MPAVNEIFAPLGNRMETTTATVYQYNSGMILRITGPELPNAYTVDFANSVTGSSISQVGGPNGVTIPDQFFVPGSYIHAWVVISGAEFAVTRYHIIIPISPRAARTNEEPTPVQQSAINQAIGALNEAVDAAETAVSHYPRINAGYWEIWDAESGEYVSTGVQAQGPQGEPGTSPEISVTPISGGHRITITYVDGTKTVDVMDGENGVGISSIVKTGTSGLADTYTITYTDGTTTTFTVTNGADGAPGFSPTVTVTDIEGGHRITITDATGPHSFDVMNGEDGQGAVQDVQVNGASVLQDGVANVPLGSGNTFGVFKTLSDRGTAANNGKLEIVAASDNQIKNGNSSYRSAATTKQHAAAFYGLAKAAGADMASISGPTVGVYPEAQKSAISEMLNGSVSVSGTTPVINALPGIRYVCGEVTTIDITPPASGICDVIFTSGSTAAVLTVPSTVKWANGFDPTALEANTTYEINIMDGLGVAGSWT